jgi:hypothetical protein
MLKVEIKKKKSMKPRIPKQLNIKRWNLKKKEDGVGGWGVKTKKKNNQLKKTKK